MIKNELLIQKRASSKYHSGGLWSNTCCSHPRENETILEAANRRIIEEMGFSTLLAEKFSFIYKAELDHGLTEHELDFVLIGKFNENPDPNPLEVEDWKYVSIDFLQSDIALHPNHYTAWFKVVLEQVIKTFKHG